MSPCGETKCRVLGTRLERHEGPTEGNEPESSPARNVSSEASIEKEKLRPFQLEGSKWLASKKLALLADEMGVGKSAQAIHALDLIQAEKVIVLCPASGRTNWLREFEKFSNLPRMFDLIFSKDTPKRPDSSIICSYSLATELASTWPGEFDALILDEVHETSSINAKRAKAILGKNGLVHRCKRIWALSGTPASNHAGELWSLLTVFGVTKLSYDSFIDKYCESYQYSHTRRAITGTKKEMIPELRAMLAPIMLRRMKEDVMKELPPINYTSVVLEPGPVDFELDGSTSLFSYVFPEDKTAEFFAEIKQQEHLVETVLTQVGQQSGDTMKMLEAMAKSVSTLRMYTGLQKVVPTVELIHSELEAKLYDKIVIFAVHRDVIEGIRNRLTKLGHDCVTLYGGTSPQARQKNIDRFQNVKKCQVFIGNIQAAGPLITLTAAHQVFFVEQMWSPGRNNQAAMRCHRFGQTKPVSVRFAGLANSIDERVAYIIRRKTKDLNAIFNKEIEMSENLLLPNEDEESSSL